MESSDFLSAPCVLKIMALEYIESVLPIIRYQKGSPTRYHSFDSDYRMIRMLISYWIKSFYLQTHILFGREGEKGTELLLGKGLSAVIVANNFRRLKFVDVPFSLQLKRGICTLSLNQEVKRRRLKSDNQWLEV